MPLSANSRKLQKKKPPVKKQWKAARSKPSETSAIKKVKAVLKLLKKNYPDAHCALHHSNAFELTVATILSAQCTDERVNKVTPFLFARYPDPQRLSQASLEDVESIIRSTNFFKNKAKSLIGMAQVVQDRYGGQIPRTVEELIELPGVGRKTANVVLGNAFNISTGIVVDTHVMRLSQRLGWTQQKDAVKIEIDLMKVIPQEDWIMLSHYLIFHGRQICKARSPGCESCFLFDLCPKRDVK